MRTSILLIILTGFYTGVFSQLSCDQSLWTHIYKPDRLQGDKKCTSIKGTVRAIKAGDDGSYRIQIKLDAGQPTAMLNDKNISAQNSCIPVVIICAHRPISNADAVKSCGTYESKVKVPAVGDHVQVIGSMVLNTEGGWNEIQPASDLIELQKR